MGLDSVLNVTAINWLQQSIWWRAAHMEGVTMKKAKAKKTDQYRRKLQHNQLFKTLAIVTLGEWDVEVVLLLKRVTTILAQYQDQSENKCHWFLVAKVSLALHCWKTVCFVNLVRGDLAKETDFLE